MYLRNTLANVLLLFIGVLPAASVNISRATAQQRNPNVILLGIESTREVVGPAKMMLNLRYVGRLGVESRRRAVVEFDESKRRFEIVGENGNPSRLIFDGARVLEFDGQESVVIRDLTNPGPNYLFDPRTLGLTVHYSQTETIRSCLGHVGAQEVQLIGIEPIKGIDCWHVRLVDSFKQQRIQD